MEQTLENNISKTRETQLNEKQSDALDAVLKGKSIFLTGSGGTGKSYLIHSLYNEVPERTNKIVALTALTGCASLLLHPKAKTIHSWAGIALGKDSVPILVSKIKKSIRTFHRWLSTDILVIDEVSMMTSELFEKLDEIGRKLRRNEHQPFGGIQLVLSGDFYQLPPVVTHTTELEKGNVNFIFESPLWKKIGLITCELTEIVRQKDPIFQQVLNEARRGELTKKSLRILISRYNIDYMANIIQPTMLFTRRAQVNVINTKYLKKLTTERCTFNSTTVLLPLAHTEGIKKEDPYLAEAITKMERDSTSHASELILAIGAQVMLTVNLSQEAGLINGSRGVVVEYQTNEQGEKVPLVQFLKRKAILIDYYTWEVPDFPGVMRRQIPLMLAYAITIHKSQGSTLDCALIDVGGKTFEYGQAYVALSRVKDLEGLFIHDLDPAAFRAHPKVKEFYNSQANL